MSVFQNTRTKESVRRLMKNQIAQWAKDNKVSLIYGATLPAENFIFERNFPIDSMFLCAENNIGTYKKARLKIPYNCRLFLWDYYSLVSWKSGMWNFLWADNCCIATPKNINEFVTAMKVYTRKPALCYVTFCLSILAKGGKVRQSQIFQSDKDSMYQIVSEAIEKDIKRNRIRSMVEKVFDIVYVSKDRGFQMMTAGYACNAKRSKP